MTAVSPNPFYFIPIVMVLCTWGIVVWYKNRSIIPLAVLALIFMLIAGAQIATWFGIVGIVLACVIALALAIGAYKTWGG